MMTYELKLCPDCGDPIHDTYNFCTNCGKDLRVKKEEVTELDKGDNPWLE